MTDRTRTLLRLGFLAMLLLGAARVLAQMVTLGDVTRVPLRELSVPSELVPVDLLPAAPGSSQGRNLLLVTLDTTRPDRLGIYGNAPTPTPNLDALGRRGVVFSKAVTTAPTTLPAHGSILTGLYPAHHGLEANGMFALDEERTTLAEVLASRGYDTAAFVSAFVLDSRFGLSQGFDVYDDEVAGEDESGLIAERTADDTTDRAIAWIEAERERPFFAWVHYFDPHQAWEPPDDYAGRHALAYDDEIAFVDAQLGRLLAAAESGDRETVVVVVGDHGEALGEHGEGSHGVLVQEGTLRVPFLLSAPGGLDTGLNVTTRASVVDVVPTVLSLLGLAAPDAVDGIDLTRAPDAGRLVYAENHEPHLKYGWAQLAAVYEGSLKYVDAPRPELYDLAGDPLETTNLAARRGAEVERLQRLVRAFQADAGEPSKSRVGLGSTQALQLEALGYVVADGEPVPPGSSGANPQDGVALYERIHFLRSVAQHPQPLYVRLIAWLSGSPIPSTPDELAAALEEIAREHPDFAPVHLHLSLLYAAAGRAADAERAERRLQAAIQGESAEAAPGTGQRGEGGGR